MTKFAAHVLTGVMFVGALGACRATAESTVARESSGCAEQTGAVDVALVAFLSKARAVHAQADLAEADADAARAVAVLDELVRAPAPGGEQPASEVREVLADTLARIAELEAQRGRFDAGRAAVRRGLALAVERTHYRGRLHEVLGALEKRAFDELRARGDEEAALAAKARSAAALREAVAIQEDVIERALGGKRP
ncbi:MAG: hypothetical protein FJ095_14400 [Deltaproteobacteria bacterium]|nr:hypothetical protein [Deltaproteobacteria bacterium]